MLHNFFRFFLLASIAVVSACGGGGDTPPPANSGGGGTTLSAPTNLKVLAEDAQATLSWNSVTDATSYTVYWSTTVSATTSDNSIDVGSNTSYIHSSLPKGHTYHYAVTASNTTEESVLSEGNSNNQAIWQWSNPLPLGSGMNASASNGSKVVAVGNAGAILSSVDAGLSWITEISGTRDALHSIVWNGSKFVTVGSNGTILTSTDGVAWTTVRTDRNSQHLFEVIAVGSTFVSVGYGGTILTSTNGESWTAQTVPAANVADYLQGITWNGTQYVVVGNSGSGGGDSVMTSPDAITWTTQTSGNTNWLYGVAWDSNNSRFVAVGDGVVMDSADAVTWTVQGPPAGLTYYYFQDVIWDGQFIAVGSGSSDYGRIITSSDGITWTARTANTDYSVNHVLPHGGQYIAMGKHSLTSTNSSTWVNQSTGLEETFNAVAWNGSKFVAISAFGKTYSSADGISWASATVSANQLSDIVWTGTNFVIVGENGLILISSDGLTWTDKSIGSLNDFTAIATRPPGNLVAVGGNIGSSAAGLTRYSIDHGVTWTNADVFGIYWKDIAWNGSQYAVVSTDGSIMTSPGEAGWSIAVQGNTNSYLFTSISAKNDLNTFVAVGQNSTGDILTSSDNGSTWVERTSGVFDGFNTVSWNGSQFMAAGFNSIITSPDGVTWSALDSITSLIYDIEWDGSQYVLVGANGTIIRGGI